VAVTIDLDREPFDGGNPSARSRGAVARKQISMLVRRNEARGFAARVDGSDSMLVRHQEARGFAARGE
jgi:hypothetical protein